jgi:hypothetical protein
LQEFIVSSPSNTTARSPSSSDRAALAQAVKLIAGKPGMSPASALRKAGIKSAAKIKQLSVELRRQQTERDQRKASNAGGRRQSNGGQATATAKALNTSRGASKKGARSSEPVKPRKSVEPGGETTARSAVALQSDMMSNWLKLYVGWWSQMMRWSPLGIMMSGNSAEHSQRYLGSVQWFSNLRQ